MLTPGPDHPITLEPAKKRWRAYFNGHVIADTNDAIVLQESSYPAVVYFPREDVGMEYLTRTERTTHCPYKGDAAYYTILMDGHFAENAVWTYEDPYPSVEAIRGRLAFYPDKVEVYPVEDATVNPKGAHTDVDEVILHTDSGDGHSQKDHWPPNTDDEVRPGEGGLR